MPHSHSHLLRLLIIHGAQARTVPEIHTLTHEFFLFFYLKISQEKLTFGSLLSVQSPAFPRTSDPANPPARLSRPQVSRGHEGTGGPGCRSEQLKPTWAEKSRMAPAGSASSTSPAAPSTTGYAPSTSPLCLCWSRIGSIRQYGASCGDLNAPCRNLVQQKSL